MTHREAVMIVEEKSKANRRKIGNNTYAQIQPDGSVTIRLHSTNVVTIHPGDGVTINSGGWRTNTTKNRINKYSPVGVCQRSHQWYFDDGTEFEDGMFFKVIVD